MPKTGSNRWNKTAGGLSKTDPFYQIFNHIRQRCNGKTNKDYSRYGGRGIKFLWESYEDFKKDMYESYVAHKKKHKTTTIERLNVNGHYEKVNCIWITIQEQAKNRRTSRYITYGGATLTIADWAYRLSTSRQAIRYRLESGWDVESIIMTPFNHSNKYEPNTKTVRTPKNIPSIKSRQSNS